MGRVVNTSINGLEKKIFLMRNLLPPEHKEAYKICWASINIMGFKMVGGHSDSIREGVVLVYPNKCAKVEVLKSINIYFQ